jgi:hypothetical protein
MLEAGLTILVASVLVFAMVGHGEMLGTSFDPGNSNVAAYATRDAQGI